MNLHKSERYLLCFYLLFVLITPAIGQVSVSGPTCVLPQVIYQYNISGNWDSTSTMQACLSGGVIADSTNSKTCTANASPRTSILVIWNNPGNASITVTSSIGNNTININVTSPLSPGSIDTVSGRQTIFYDSIPSIINCSPDTGGSCSPTFLDQWQQSTDMLGWSDISGATAQNLTFNSPLVQATFYRRKVIETSSGTIGYSNIALVDVAIPIPQSDSSANQNDSSSGNGAGNNLRNENHNISGNYRLVAYADNMAFRENYFDGMKQVGLKSGHN